MTKQNDKLMSNLPTTLLKHLAVGNTPEHFFGEKPWDVKVQRCEGLDGMMIEHFHERCSGCRRRHRISST